MNETYYIWTQYRDGIYFNTGVTAVKMPDNYYSGGYKSNYFDSNGLSKPCSLFYDAKPLGEREINKRKGITEFTFIKVDTANNWDLAMEKFFQAKKVHEELSNGDEVLYNS